MVEKYISEKDICTPIIESAFEAHKALGGPGLTKEIYSEALAWELASRGFEVEREISIPVSYKGIQLEASLHPNLLVNNQVLINVEVSNVVDPLRQAEVMTCLRLLKLSQGLVINFGAKSIKEGISTLSVDDCCKSSFPATKSC